MSNVPVIVLSAIVSVLLVGGIVIGVIALREIESLRNRTTNLETSLECVNVAFKNSVSNPYLDAYRRTNTEC